jgi:hypothetical protein
MLPTGVAARQPDQASVRDLARNWHSAPIDGRDNSVDAVLTCSRNHDRGFQERSPGQKRDKSWK